MKLTTKNKPRPNLDMTSATDIMFLLLIFFMVAVSSVSQQAIEINLPTSTTSDQIASQINITITADTKFYLENELIEKEHLKTILHEKIKTENKNIVLYTDKSVPIEYIVYVADIASSLGVKMAIATTAHLAVNTIASNTKNI